MKLQVVTYTIHHKINKYILYLFYIMLIIATISINQFLNIFLWLAIVIGLVCVICFHIFKSYAIIGSCLVDLHSARLKYKASQELIEFSEILFIYGGYKGKDDWLYIFTGQTVKSGVNNYLIFKKNNATKVQIMLNSKKEYKELLDKLTELEASGVKVQKTRYSVFEFRNIMKKLTLFF